MSVHSIPVSELRQHLDDVLERLERTGDPYYLTQHSRPQAVLVRYEDYHSLVEQAAAGHPRIARRPDISGGEPLIKGTRITVRRIVEMTRMGDRPEDILAALPHLTPAQVYDALSYYYDHPGEIDQLMAESAPERVLEAQGLVAERIDEGVARVRSTAP